MSPKKKKKDKQLEEPTFKPYHNLDHSESSNHSGSENSGKKKKKKSKKRSSSSDREKAPESGRSQTTRGRSASMGYATARVPNRSRSGEKIEHVDPSPDSDPDPVIGPAYAGPTDGDAPNSPGKKKKKNKIDMENAPPQSPEPDHQLNAEMNRRRNSNRQFEKEGIDGTEVDAASNGDLPDKTRVLAVDDDTPRTRNRSGPATEESIASPVLASESISPKIGRKKSVDSLSRRSSPKSPQKDAVRMTPRKHPSSHDSPGRAPIPQSPNKAHRRRQTSQSTVSPPTEGMSPAGRTAGGRRRVRKTGEAKIYDSDGKEIKLPMDSEDESEPKSTDGSAENESGKVVIENQENMGRRSPGKTAFFLGQPKNPKLVQHLRECIRLVAKDETGPSVEASLRGLAEYLTTKNTNEDGEIPALAVEVLAADFVPRNKNSGKEQSGSGLVDQEGQTHSFRPESTVGQKLSFDPYKPSTPQQTRRKVSPVRRQSPLRRQSPTRQRSPMRKQSSASSVEGHATSSTGDLPVEALSRSTSIHSASNSMNSAPQMTTADRQRSQSRESNGLGGSRPSASNQSDGIQQKLQSPAA